MKIVVYSPEPCRAPVISPEAGQHRLTSLEGDVGAMVRQLSVQQPDLVILSGFNAAGSRYVEEVEKLCLALPKAAVVSVHPHTEPELLLSLMRAGVREVVADTGDETIRQLIMRTQQRTNGAAPKKNGRVLAFVSAKGGDGSSSLAANMAFALSRIPGKRVLAVDVSLPFGDLDMYLTGEEHEQDLADISAECERLDRSLLDSMVQHVSPSLDLIASPARFDKIVEIEPERVSELTGVAAGCYDYVLLDLGSCLDPVGIWVLEHVDELAVVMTPSLPSLRRAGQLLNLSGEFEKPVSRIDVILNRADASSRIQASEMEKIVGRPVDRRIPSDAASLEEALLVGRPLVESAPASKLSRTIVDWAAGLAGSEQPKESLWQRLKIR
ncbi:AAA family ATPase [Chlorobium sp. N1]|uniref:nucleotide-binding protein n=1 Tax=Chlorobium sp. N1 TaxID=2491138 RepID=UPI00103B6931|nr:AAA family ATPase [Chlorobium sp. N1]TCD47233.1 pilus assembly protein CpaB [Chlorobium sp. N1]